MDGDIRSELEFTLDAMWTRKGRGVVGAWMVEGGGTLLAGYGALPTPDILFERALEKAQSLYEEGGGSGCLTVRLPLRQESGVHSIFERDTRRGRIDRKTGLPHSSFLNVLAVLQGREVLRVRWDGELHPLPYRYLSAFARFARLLPAYPEVPTEEQQHSVLAEVEAITDHEALGAYLETCNPPRSTFVLH